MNITRALALAALAIGLGAGLSVHAQETPPGPPPASRPARGPRGGGGAPMNLEGAMRDMGQNLKSLKSNAADPAKREDSLRNVISMERDAAVAKLQLPPSVQHLSGDEKATKAEQYRVEMSDLQKALMSLEDAIAAKNADDINKGLDSLAEIMKKGHTDFIPKRENE